MKRSIRHRWDRFRVALVGLVLGGVGWSGAVIHAAEPGPSAEPDHLVLRGVGAAGTGVAQPQRWTLVQALIDNPTDKPQDARFVFQFPDLSGMQFVRPVWLPPRTQLEAQLPVRFGEGKAGKAVSAAQTEALLLPPRAERELGRSPGLIRLTTGSALAVLEDSETRGDMDPDDSAVAAVAGLREMLGEGKSTYPFRAYDTVRQDTGWTGVAAFLLTADHPALDAVQTRAIRRWLHAGGRLIAFTDQVDPQALADLLGPEWGLSRVDRQSLVHLKFSQPADEAPSNEYPLRPVGATLDVERPITMARMLASDPAWRTVMSVNGWPAILSRACGRGRVAVVTVGGRAWKELQKDLDKHEERRRVVRVAAEAMVGSGGGFVTAHVQPQDVIAGSAGERFIASQLGYRVAGRSVVGPLMAIVPGAILLVGLVGWRTRRLEWVAGGGAVASIGAAVALLVVGAQQRGKVAPTAVSLQYVAASADSPTVRVDSLTGFYFPSGATLSISSDRGGWAWPVPLHRTGSLERMIHADLDRWSWPSLTIAAAAVRPLHATADVTLPVPLKIKWRYDDRGLVGELNWPSNRRFEDPVIVTAHAMMNAESKRVGGKIELRVGARNVLGSSQTLGSETLSQQQQDRSTLLRELAQRCRWTEPTLLAWSGPMDTGVKLSPAPAKRGESLWSIPLSGAAEAAGRVRVPWPLVKMVGVRDTQRTLGLSMLPLYRADQQQWLDHVPNPSAFLGRFMLPAGVRDLKLGAVKLHLDMTAIGRPVRIITVRDGRVVTLAKLQGPDGPRVIDLPAQKLAVEPGGGVLVGFDVKNPANFDPSVVQNSNMWTVRRFALEVAGQVEKK